MEKYNSKITLTVLVLMAKQENAASKSINIVNTCMLVCISDIKQVDKIQCNISLYDKSMLGTKNIAPYHHTHEPFYNKERGYLSFLQGALRSKIIFCCEIIWQS